MWYYINEGLILANNLPMDHLPRLIPIYNADGSHNKGGPITHIVTLHLWIENHVEVFPFAVTNMGKTDIIVGFNWLQKHNLSVDWKTGGIMFDCCLLECGLRLRRIEEEEEEEEEEKENEIEDGDCTFVTKLCREEEWIASTHPLPEAGCRRTEDQT